MRRAGQLREEAVPCPDHVFLIPEVRRSPQPHVCRKAPRRSKGVTATNAKLPALLCGRKPLAKGCMFTQGRIWRYPKYGPWTRQIRMTGQRETGDAPCKWLKLLWGCHSGTLALRPPVCPSTRTGLFPLNNYFTSSWKLFCAKPKDQSPCHWPLV